MNKPTETAEITVAYVNPPKPDKKWGNIKSTAGDSYWGPPAMLSRYKPGETCKVEYELGGNDGTLRTLRHKIDVPQALARPVSPPPRARTNPSDSEQINSIALLKEFIARGDVALQRDAIKAALQECKSAVNDVFGNPKKQETEAEFNDEIPY